MCARSPCAFASSGHHVSPQLTRCKPPCPWLIAQRAAMARARRAARPHDSSSPHSRTSRCSWKERWKRASDGRWGHWFVWSRMWDVCLSGLVKLIWLFTASRKGLCILCTRCTWLHFSLTVRIYISDEFFLLSGVATPIFVYHNYKVSLHT
jgi:hypothetical protein